MRAKQNESELVSERMGERRTSVYGRGAVCTCMPGQKARKFV